VFHIFGALAEFERDYHMGAHASRATGCTSQGKAWRQAKAAGFLKKGRDGQTALQLKIFVSGRNLQEFGDFAGNLIQVKSGGMDVT
jgi:hypothetical protein